MDGTRTNPQQILREDLAAAFHLAVEFDWIESVGNHFSAATSADGRRFLMNRKWMHFSEVTASNLQEFDLDDPSVMEGPDAPDPTAWSIHGAIHAANPEARVVLHMHPPHATAVAALADPTILPIDQNTARFFGKVAIDLGFDGLADDPDEGRRIASQIGGREVLMMGNHGVTVVGPTVAHAFESLYFLERACRTLILALSTGRPLNVMSDNLAAKTAASWEPYADSALAHFAALRRGLDAKGGAYAR